MSLAYWLVAGVSSVVVAILHSHTIEWPLALTVARGVGATWLILCGLVGIGAWQAVGVVVLYVVVVAGLAAALVRRRDVV